MGEILGLGVTHWPVLTMPDSDLTRTMKLVLSAPNTPAWYKDRNNWPKGFIEELGDDEGQTAARACGERLHRDFQTARKILDDFNPDFVVVWGDDQYENFTEDIVPPFCVFGMDDEFDLHPWEGGKANRWNEPGDWPLKLRGHREGAKYLASGLLRRGIDMPYAYKPLHVSGLAHAFTNTFLYLDWDRVGFPYPVVPFAVNCYGSGLLETKGGFAHLFAPPKEKRETLPDPPGPQPWRCMQVGAAVAQAISESPWRVALVASSSWSHAFLSPKNGYLWSDWEGDRLLFEALQRGDYDVWRNRSLEDMEASGQHEMLNWMVLVGAMEALGRKPVIHDYQETYVFTSEKCFASFPPNGA